MLTNLIMLAIIATVIIIYFANNPIRHEKNFRIRCFWNWFPLGLTYAFLYMGRYNLTVAKGALGNLLTKQDFGDIFGLGALVYGFAFIINGPLTDKMGGKKAMLIGTAGSIISNAVMGYITWGTLTGVFSKTIMVHTFLVIYALNMYFQSFGAVSVIKVNSHWFHVRERGIQGGVFGTLIALGLFYAFDWGDIIVKATTLPAAADLGVLEKALRALLGTDASAISQTWYVFFIPAIILVIFFFILLFVTKDSPSEAGFPEIETGDAVISETALSGFGLIKKLLTNPVVLTIAFIEFCSGIIRQSIMHWYKIFAEQQLADPIKAPLYEGARFFLDNWGLLLCLAGIFGGFLAGYISDKLFGSRRGPSAVFLYGAMVLAVAVMVFTLNKNQQALGIIVMIISLCVIGVHGMLSGTATMDFGGKKAAATATGLVDGFVYLGTALQGFALGRLTSIDWSYWPLFMLPFTIIGLIFSMRIWKAFPNSQTEQS